MHQPMGEEGNDEGRMRLIDIDGERFFYVAPSSSSPEELTRLDNLVSAAIRAQRQQHQQAAFKLANNGHLPDNDPPV